MVGGTAHSHLLLCVFLYVGTEDGGVVKGVVCAYDPLYCSFLLISTPDCKDSPCSLVPSALLSSVCLSVPPSFDCNHTYRPTRYVVGSFLHRDVCDSGL